MVGCEIFRRKKLALRRVTTPGRELPKTATDTIKSFINECFNKLSGVDNAAIFNMDETSWKNGHAVTVIIY